MAPLALGLGLSPALGGGAPDPLAAYAVNGVSPSDVLDFQGDLYFIASEATTFDAAHTYANTSGAPLTMTDSDETTKYQPHNLTPENFDMDAGAWNRDAGIVPSAHIHADPDGGTLATLIAVGDNSRIYRNNTSVTGKAGIWLKAGTLEYPRAVGCDVNTVTGLLVSPNTAGTLTDIGGGWFYLVSDERTTIRHMQLQAYDADTFLSHTTAGNYYAYGPHVYETTLYDMVDNPARGDKYVPNDTANPIYLARNGHHFGAIRGGLLFSVPDETFTISVADGTYDVRQTLYSGSDIDVHDVVVSGGSGYSMASSGTFTKIGFYPAGTL